MQAGVGESRGRLARVDCCVKGGRVDCLYCAPMFVFVRGETRDDNSAAFFARGRREATVVRLGTRGRGVLWGALRDMGIACVCFVTAERDGRDAGCVAGCMERV